MSEFQTSGHREPFIWQDLAVGGSDHLLLNAIYWRAESREATRGTEENKETPQSTCSRTVVLNTFCFRIQILFWKIIQEQIYIYIVCFFQIFPSKQTCNPVHSMHLHFVNKEVFAVMPQKNHFRFLKESFSKQFLNWTILSQCDEHFTI